jgi:hypothetical protein
MNLHQFRVLSALLGPQTEFTTGDLVRMTGVSPEVVRKTYQRYDRFFTVVREESSGPSGGRRKVRTLTPVARVELEKELLASRSLLPPPPLPHGAEGEPLGLVAAEQTFYDGVPACGREKRRLLLIEARSYLELTEQAFASASDADLSSDHSPPSAAFAVRLEALQRMLGYADVLDSAQGSLRDKKVPEQNIAKVDLLATALLNAKAAKEYAFRDPSSRQVEMAGLLASRLDAPGETERIARCLLGLGRESAWCRALGISGPFWTKQEENQLLTFEGGIVSDRPKRAGAFAITVENWIEADHSDPRVRSTGASLCISVGDKVATRHIAPSSKSIEDCAPVSAYPLALWLTKGWWRLRWEPAPWGLPTSAWRSAHDLSTIGNGFLWPSLRLAFNGEQIYAQCRPTRVDGSESVRYLEGFEEAILPSNFEFAVDTFVNQVLAQLSASGFDLNRTDLAAAWCELSAERADPTLTDHRRLEAMLGLNRNEGPYEAIQGLKDLSTPGGESAVYELAPAYSGCDLGPMLTKTREIVGSSEGVRGRIVRSISVRDSSLISLDEPPWQRGLGLARECRKWCGFGSGRPISDADLAETLGLSEMQFENSEAPAEALPFGLAIREASTDNVKFLFQHRKRAIRRFEAARFLADAFLTHSSDDWLIATQAKTARQQTQRAFAIEMLAPIDCLRERLQGNFSIDAVDEAAAYYDVSAAAVHRHLELNVPEFAAAARS